MLLEIHVQAVRKKMSQMLVFRFQAVMRSEIKVAKVMMSHCQEKLLARTILPVPQTDTGSRVALRRKFTGAKHSTETVDVF